MLSHGGCGLLCPLLSHGSTVGCLLAGPLQLMLWGEMQTLVKHHCYLYVACLLACCDACHHSLSKIGLWSKTGMMLQTCLLNISVAGLGNPWPNGVVWICSRAMFMSLPELVHFLNVHLTNLIHTSTCPLIWW